MKDKPAIQHKYDVNQVDLLHMTNQEPAQYYCRDIKKIRYNICICCHLTFLFKVSSSEVHQGGKKVKYLEKKTIVDLYF